MRDLLKQTYNQLMSCKAARFVVAAISSFLLLLLAPAGAQRADTPIAVDGAELSEHQFGAQGAIRARVPPGFGREIQLQVVVNARGEVESAHALNGFPDLFAEAEALEKKRHFKPFERSGQAVRTFFTDFVPVYPPEEWASPRIPFPKIEHWNSLRIKLERLPCYGPCPVYSVEVHGNGDVFYEGIGGLILITGHHRDRISHDTVARLVSSFRQAEYFSLKDEYAILGNDLPTFITSIEFDGHKKRVVDFAGYQVGMPKAAARLENLIDEAAQTGRWLRGTNGTAPSLLRERWNFKANTPDNDKLFAAAVRRPDVLKLYLEHGLPPLNSPNRAQSPLVSASYYGNPSLLARLMRNCRGLPAPLLASALSAAAAVGDVPTMRFLIARGASPSSAVSDEDDLPLPLISAVLSGRAAAVDELLKFHPDVSATSKYGEDAITTLLTRTVDQSEDRQILTALISAGANVNARDSLYGQTPVFKASDAANSVDILHLLAKAGADLDARDKFGRTPLSACFDTDYARALIGLGADVFARDNQGKTAVDAAREMADNELAGMLESAMVSKRTHN